MKKKKESSMPKGYIPLTTVMSGSEKILRICNQESCNKEFVAKSKFVRTCPECKKKNSDYLNLSEIDHYSVLI